MPIYGQMTMYYNRVSEIVMKARVRVTGQDYTDHWTGLPGRFP